MLDLDGIGIIAKFGSKLNNKAFDGSSVVGFTLERRKFVDPRGIRSPVATI